MTVEFGPVTRQTVAEQVRARLAERIASGELAPGQPVPAERSLSEQFGVARTSVREALQGLASMRLVERRGNRMYVAELLPEVAFASPAESEADERKQYVAQLFETRRVLELPIFELAACRAGDDEREAIRRAAHEFWVGMPLDEFRALDRRFHTLIAGACGNALLVEMYGKVLEALFRSAEFESLLFDEANRASVDELIATSIADHTAIAKAIHDGVAVDTVAAAERHLANVEHRMVDDLI
jgi:GntR family transcriptional regulator, transcriptional repressor for pyruvate dehydrogenase complex